MTEGKQTVSGLARAFVEDTSIHGVGKFASRRSLFRKILWFLLVLIASGVALYNIINVIQDFFSWPVATVLSINNNNKIHFPAVTLCNLNPIRLSKLYEETTQPDIRFLQQLFSAYSGGGANLTDEVLEEYLSLDPDDQYLMFLLVSSILANVDQDLKRELGHEIDDMLLLCQFAGESCDASHFEYFYDYKYGNCFTFNTEETWTTSESGPLHGLVLELYLEEGEYTGLLADSVGVRLLVGGQSTVPMPDDEGVVVGPGLDSYIGITKQEIIRALPPHGDCQLTRPGSVILDIIQGWGTKYTYSHKACMKACLQINLIKTCGCCSNVIPCPATAFRTVTNNISASARICAFPSGGVLTEAMEQDIRCAGDIVERFHEDELSCTVTCYPSCSETAFNAEVSSAFWPSTSTVNHVRGKVLRKTQGTDIDNSSVTEQFIRRNTLKLHVFFKMLNHETIHTRPAYNVQNLIANIGGSGGLWLGFSVLTFIELLELIFDIVASVCGRPRQTMIKPLN